MRKTGCGFIMGLSMLLSLPAMAQKPGLQFVDEEDTREKKEAKTHFEKGLTLVEQENWEAAILEFEESMRLYPTKSAALNMAMCLKALHRYLEAIDAFEDYIEKYGRELDGVRRAEAENNLKELRALLGTLMVKVSVDGAKITIGGKEKGRSPMKEGIALGPGFHTIKVEAPGYIPEERDIPIVSGKTRLVDIYLVKAPRVGFITVESNMEGASVVIDGEKAGTVPFKGDLDVGKHTIVVSKEGNRDYSVTIDIKLNQVRIINATLKPIKKIKKYWFWSTTGVAIACTAATAALGASVVALDKDYDPYGSSREDYDLGKNLMTATDVSLGLAAGSAISALILFFFTDWKARPSRIVRDDKNAGNDRGAADAMLHF